MKAHIKVEGLREMQAALKKSQGKLPDSIGQAHKRVGQFVIAKLPPADPHAVGAGSGASVRPSATKREVLLRVGHSKREAAKDQWGRKEVQPFAPGRPYIVGTVERYEDEIVEEFRKQVLEAVGPAFCEVK